VIVFLSEYDVSEQQRWIGELAALLPDEHVVEESELVNPVDADIAVVANPGVEVWSRLPRLRLVQSLWAGVDRLISVVPEVARLVDPQMTSSMVATVVAHVLHLHLQHNKYALFQREHMWQPLDQPATNERNVALLGLGALGAAAATALVSLGFQVLGWSRDKKAIDGVESFVGDVGLLDMLSRADIVVNLLPLTDETRGILDAARLERLPRGVSLINVGRGAHVNTNALISVLMNGQLDFAILDTFDIEPLPPDHAFWSHQRVSVFPHVAAQTSRASACRIAADNITRFRLGEPVHHLVDRNRGY
jgi:glyoxylate/hydroxypyruvate reductase